MEEIAYMVCMRVDELDDPVENSTTTACVECGTDVWISAESRKELSKVKAMPLCSKCAVRVAQENETETTMGMPSSGQFSEIMQALKKGGKDLDLRDLPPEIREAMEALPDDIDPFDALKATARMAANAMTDPDSEWGSMAVVIDFQGHSMPAIPMQEMLDGGVPKEVIAKQLIPACAQAANAERVLFGISTWALTGEGQMPEPGTVISEHPDRSEALVLIDVTADGVKQMSMAEITRDGVNGPILGEWKDTEKPDASSGGLFLDTLIPVLQLIKKLQEVP